MLFDALLCGLHCAVFVTGWKPLRAITSDAVLHTNLSEGTQPVTFAVLCLRRLQSLSVGGSDPMFADELFQ